MVRIWVFVIFRVFCVFPGVSDTKVVVLAVVVFSHHVVRCSELGLVHHLVEDADPREIKLWLEIPKV